MRTTERTLSSRSLWAMAFVLMASSCAAQSPAVRRSHLGESKAPVLFTFAHITDTHIGERTAGGDFGTIGFLNDMLTGSEAGYTIDRLRNTMQHLNEMPSAARPAFIIHSGDLTDSGERSELLMTRQLLEGPIPCIPLMGNHDAWPYNSFGTEAATACGDSMMNVVFGDVFARLQQGLAWDDGTRTKPFTCPVSGNKAFLQNYAFIQADVRFVFLDFNPRYHVPKDAPGIGPEAYLTEGEGGTLPFLKGQLALAEQRNERVILIVHHPPVTAVVGKRFAFSKGDKSRLAELLRPHRDRTMGLFCGHLHRWAHYHFSKAGIAVFETKAVKSAKRGAVRMVTVHAVE